MKSYNVAVVGATGLVGRKMTQVLEEHDFPVKNLTPLASERSVGKEISFKGEKIKVRKLMPESFRGIEIALFSAGATVSKEFAPIAAKEGTVVIDNSSAWRMDPAIPLVVPEVNRDDIFKHHGIIANPNCSTIQMVVVLKPLHDEYKIKRVVVSTYQSVTGAGQKGIDQLDEELGKKQGNTKKFPHKIAFNCLPHIDVFREDGYTKEEFKMIFETTKIMGDDSIKVSPTCVRVPVFGGHSEAVNIEMEHSYELEDVIKLLKKSPGIIVEDDPSQNIYPMPLNAYDKDEVFVGRIRRDESAPNSLNMWIVSDNIRKGAATNAVQIAEELIKGRD
ncbi:MAG TPA: aspartate-semialdehyde dehydrogenase [Candidatus Acidoferrales bacterium]|nr:aspartate-semialdehyde dehydrogenase [Candidatus Acidoferrales bacterium]